jgi:non-ribosomal peptide synthetase component F
VTVTTDLQPFGTLAIVGEPAAQASFGSPSAPVRRTLVDILDATVQAHPAARAIDTADATLTYRELADRVEALRATLSGHGIGAGDHLLQAAQGVRVPVVVVHRVPAGRVVGPRVAGPGPRRRGCPAPGGTGSR